MSWLALALAISTHFGRRRASRSRSARKNEGWERRASLSGINKAAQRKADALVGSSGSPVAEPDKPDTKPDAKPDASGKLAQATREDSEEKRAAVLARHRTEWGNVGVLVNNAVAERTKQGGDPVKASDMIRFAKVTAETTKLKQEGERKAWGLDDLADFDPSKMSDEDLERFIRGR
jgi:hypothetical protein